MLVIVLKNLMRFFTKKSFYHQGFFAVKRRTVFILGAMWWTLVRGWRRDCVVGGMETRFQWRKAHNPYAKCEAFHIAPRLFFPRLFFMFLFLISFTIRQQCIIYPHKFSSEPGFFVALWGSHRFNNNKKYSWKFVWLVVAWISHKFSRIFTNYYFFLTSSLRTPKIFVEEFCDFLVPCH